QRVVEPVIEEQPGSYDETLDWRIVGGSTASSGQFPYIASLRRSTGAHFCGSSIISTRYVVSAAHCTVGTSTGAVAVVVGTNTLNSGGVRYAVDRIVNHASYNPSTIANDISLVRTSSTIATGTLVRTIAISSGTVGGGVSAVISGWGTLQVGGSTPNNLQFLNVATVTNTECAQRQSPNQIFSTQVCTFSRSGQGACHGDSGGPLVSSNILIGAVSWGRPCGIGFPDVFTRISSYVSWIQSNAT
ncbi:Serine protease, partial [Rhyzopertha dominica]